MYSVGGVGLLRGSAGAVVIRRFAGGAYARGIAGARDPGVIASLASIPVKFHSGHMVSPETYPVSITHY